MARSIDLTGKRFGRLLVTGRASPRSWKCTCDCGRPVEHITARLKNGHVKSCGCLSASLARQRRLTHGKRGTRLYAIWNMMIQRCTNPNNKSFPQYGGRGIVVCEEWKQSFARFLAAVGEPSAGMTLDRINNDRGYEPGNVRWATRVTQNRNRSITTTVTHGGVTRSLAEWSELTSIPLGVLRLRIGYGWAAERVLTHPYIPKPPSRKPPREAMQQVYWGMVGRCCNPNHYGYAYYGGRGIQVCERWLGKSGSSNFIADMGMRPSPQHTLDRIDPDGNYTPANCRWATRKEQAKNRRVTSE